MAIEFKLPAVSEGVESVDIAEIRVSEGDTIEAGAILCEVETDKSVAEVECPHAGTIAKVFVSQGQSVNVGEPLVLIEESAAAPNDAADSQPEPTAAEEPQTASSATTDTAAPPATPQETSQSEPVDVEFCMPVVAEGVTSVDIAEVKVSPGDVINANDIICEAETDKSVAEIECPHAGTIKAVHFAAGDTVNVGAPLVTIQTSAAGKSAARKSAAGSPAPPAPSSTPAKAAATDRPSTVAPAVAPTSASAIGQSAADGRPPAPAGPATRRLARKLGVDLHDVKGSANGGRIVIEDVEAYVKNRLTQSPSGQGSVGVVAAAPLPDFSRFGPIEKQPLNKILRTAAANLHAAWITIPHVTQHNDADITELEKNRRMYVKANPNSPKITMTAIMIKAVVGALKAFPKVNSSIDLESGELILKKYYHIGVAVDTPNGLVVPVIRNCDQKGVLQVASELTDIAVRARDRKLKPEDMQGASFTITNLGGIGGTCFTPIVNYPEVAILGMSRGQKVVQLDDGQVVERLMLPLSLSYDHRAINGADAARFIVKLSGSLTNFFELF